MKQELPMPSRVSIQTIYYILYSTSAMTSDRTASATSEIELDYFYPTTTQDFCAAVISSARIRHDSFVEYGLVVHGIRTSPSMDIFDKHRPQTICLETWRRCLLFGICYRYQYEFSGGGGIPTSKLLGQLECRGKSDCTT